MISSRSPVPAETFRCGSVMGWSARYKERTNAPILPTSDIPVNLRHTTPTRCRSTPAPAPGAHVCCMPAGCTDQLPRRVVQIYCRNQFPGEKVIQGGGRHPRLRLPRAERPK